MYAWCLLFNKRRDKHYLTDNCQIISELYKQHVLYLMHEYNRYHLRQCTLIWLDMLLYIEKEAYLEPGVFWW